MFGKYEIKELQREMADVNRKLERILWILKDRPSSIDEAFKQQFISEVDQAYKRKAKSIIKYKIASPHKVDKVVAILRERPYTIRQIGIKLKLTESSVRTYIRDARRMGHSINLTRKRRSGKQISYYSMEA